MPAIVWKPQGWTPLNTVRAYRKIHPEFEKVPVSYAGRLDPMAEGILILLRGEENKERSVYEKLRKTYEVRFVLGVTTDTLDALGIVQMVSPAKISVDEIQSTLQTFVCSQKQVYPHYSSRTVQGKPLYWWARQGRVSEIVIPSKSIDIYAITLLKTETVSIQSVIGDVIRNIQNVAGDFRQQDIVTAWQRVAKVRKQELVTIVTMRVSCSSGTYMRQLVSDIGAAVGCGAFALSIIRMKVGKYTARDAFRNSDGIIGSSTRFR